MKKKIIILGSTGSIGKKTLDIIKNDKNNFHVFMLSANKNIKLLLFQAKKFNVKHVVINNENKFLEAKKIFKKNKINIYNNFDKIDSILKKIEIYYSMVSVTGLEGLQPSLLLSKYSKNLAIVNKESLICGWNLIKKKLKKYNTKFIPIDSEHYSIFSLIKNHSIKDIEKIYITASGGPFNNTLKSKFKKIQLKDALKHPNWLMGKKITIDSATLMNKVFEVIEARNIFEIPYDKIDILIHHQSYIHSLIKFKNGLIKIIAHEPDMKFPIFNSIYNSNEKSIISEPINFNVLNNLSLKSVDKKKFPFVNILNNLPNFNSLYETVLVTVNDFFVEKFLKKKINFNELILLTIKFINRREFQKYKKIKVRKLDDITKVRKFVIFKINSLYS